jgi:hypothetical protein
MLFLGGVHGFAIDLVRRHVNESLNLAIDTAALDKNMGSQDIVIGKRQRIVEGALYVGLRGEVDDVGGLVGGKNPLDKIEILEVPVHKMVAGVMPNSLIYVLLVCAIVHGVQIHEGLDAFGKIVIDEMAADEAVATGYEEPHKC